MCGFSLCIHNSLFTHSFIHYLVLYIGNGYTVRTSYRVPLLLLFCVYDNVRFSVLDLKSSCVHRVFFFYFISLSEAIEWMMKLRESVIRNDWHWCIIYTSLLHLILACTSSRKSKLSTQMLSPAWNTKDVEAPLEHCNNLIKPLDLALQGSSSAWVPFVTHKNAAHWYFA